MMDADDDDLFGDKDDVGENEDLFGDKDEEKGNDDLFGDEDEDTKVSKPKEVDEERKVHSEVSKSEDLFGDDDGSEVEEESKSIRSTAKNEKENLFGSDEEEDEEDALEKKTSTSSAPKTNNNLDSIFGDGARAKKKTSKLCLPVIPTRDDAADAQNILVRVPNFLHFQPKEFDKETHNEEEERVAFKKTTSVIRWRQQPSPEGSVKSESNARLLKWSDGTYQLIVGDAVFNASIYPQKNCFIFKYQRSTSDPDDSQRDPEEQPQQRSCLEGIAPVAERIVFQPTSLDSEVHALMAAKISHLNKGKSGIQFQDFDTLSGMKAEEEQEKLAKARDEENRRDRRRERASGGYYADPDGHEGLGGRPRPSMSADFLNDSGNFDSTNLSMLKGKKPLQPQRKSGASSQASAWQRRYPPKKVTKNRVRKDGTEDIRESDGEEEDEEEANEDDMAFIDNDYDDDEDEDGDVEEEDDDDDDDDDMPTKASSAKGNKAKSSAKKPEKKTSKPAGKRRRMEEEEEEEEEEDDEESFKDDEEDDDDDGGDDGDEAEADEDDDKLKRGTKDKGKAKAAQSPAKGGKSARTDSSAAAAKTPSTKSKPLASPAREAQVSSGAGGDDDDDDDNLGSMQMQRKRSKRTIIEDDDDDE